MAANKCTLVLKGANRRRRRRSWSPGGSDASRPRRRWCGAATSGASQRSPRSWARRGGAATLAPRSVTAPWPRWPLRPRPLSTIPALRQVHFHKHHQSSITTPFFCYCFTVRLSGPYSIGYCRSLVQISILNVSVQVTVLQTKQTLLDNDGGPAVKCVPYLPIMN